MKTLYTVVLVILTLTLLAGCTTPAPTAAPAAAPTTAPAADRLRRPRPRNPLAAPAAAGKDVKGMKACYLIPALSNTFLNNLANSVKTKAAADGIEVSSTAPTTAARPSSTRRSRTASRWASRR